MLFGNSIQEYYLKEVRNVSRARTKRLRALRTSQDAWNYVHEVRSKIRGAFPLPEQKTPLNTTVMSSERRYGLVFKNLLYYSRPSYPVTANLIIPEHAEKNPGVLFLCGHSELGKACASYQTAAINLAAQGFAVLVVDPVSQGERFQLSREKQFASMIGSNCDEHNMIGKQLYLLGDFFGAWRAWDAIRGLDCLLEQPEVDPERIGVTGNSGGGTMTMYLNALEDRILMSAPSCAVTTWRHQIENELPADSEQIPRGMLSSGIDFADFIIAGAPRPVLILGQKNDFFDPRGTLEAYDEVRFVYGLLGKENCVKVFVGPDGHGFFPANRKSMYSFFQRHAFGKSAPEEKPELLPRSKEKTNVMATGNTLDLPGSKRIFDFIREQADQLAVERKPLSTKELRKAMKEILRMGPVGVPHFRILRNSEYHDLKLSRFGIESEPGQVMSVLKVVSGEVCFHIPQVKSATLYIPHLSTEQELPLLRTGNGEMLFSLEVRGIGELEPSGCGQGDRRFFRQYLFDYHYASLGYLMNRPFPGGKVRDVLSALKLMKENGIQEISLLANGQGTVPALLAALFFKNLKSVRLMNAPESWDSMVRKPLTNWPLSMMLPGVLKKTDLPEIAKTVKNLQIDMVHEPLPEKKR